MSLRDFQAAEKKFEAAKKTAAAELTKLIDKRMAIIRKTVPEARFSDAMGTSSFYIHGHGSNTTDPLYIAGEYLQGDRTPPTEETYGEALPEHLAKANEIYERYAEIMSEIFEIAVFLNDEVKYTYD